MKTIGIKLADGSFYPVLEDNTPSEKKLELTTAHNNQTKVMVDLYRSATCSMDDAEYVDSLQIENLTARPNGETDIKFSISLDEDNQLSARIVDPETGNESNTTITLVSRTLEERLVTDDYAINDSEENSGAGAALAGAAAAGGLLAAAAALRNNEAQEETAETEEQEATSESIELTDTVEETEIPLDETSVDEPVIEEDITAKENTELPDMDFNLPEDAPSEETIVSDEPEVSVEDSIIEDNPAEEENTELPDMDFNLPEDAPSEENTALPDMDFDLPDDTAADEISLDDTESDEPIIDSDETIVDSNDTIIDSNETIEEDSGFSSMDFNIPDDTASDETVSAETITSSDTFTEESSGLPDMDFDFPDETSNTNETENPELPDDFFTTEDDMKDPTFDTESPAAGGINFDGLYDEETERGTPAQNDEYDVKKKTKVPVIICIVCAIICIIATLLILFIIPSKYNLITKKNAKDTGTTVAVAAEQPAPEPSPAPQVEPEPEPEPAVPEAKEDEVIIIEKAEEVVPHQPPVAEEKPKNITYTIKWGDTLWDIADTYYKNPWRYKYIARYNGIKNPDYIISGTKIVIPAE